MAKEWRSACGVALVRQAERAAQLLHGELDHARRQRPAPAPTNSGPSGGSAIGTERRDIPRPPRRIGSITGTVRILRALAGDGHRIDRPDRRVCAADAERLGDAQARAVKQRQHGGIAREDPGLARVAGAQLGAR